MTDRLALVLTGGGARAAYQVGVLSGVARLARVEPRLAIVTGVSAGAINALFLAAHPGGFRDSVTELERLWRSLSIEQIFHAGLGSLLRSGLRSLRMLVAGNSVLPVQPHGLLDTTPLRRLLTRHIDPDGIRENIKAGRLEVLALSATNYATGQTVTFVEGIEESASWSRAGRTAVAARVGIEHVMASSALPILFPAVRLGQEYFGDGSIRMMAPLAPAIHLGATRILTIAVRGPRIGDSTTEPRQEGYPTPAQIMGMLLNSVFMDALDSDTERLERINRTLSFAENSGPHPDGLRPIELGVARPSTNLGRLAADYRFELPQTLSIFVRGLGDRALRSPDLVSYLLFERPWIERLIELGQADVERSWPRLAPLFDRVPPEPPLRQ